MDDIEEEWLPFSLTHVEYPSGDLVGKLLALSSLIPVAIIVGFITLILFRRDLHTIFFFCGIVLSEGCNLILKQILQQPRPFSRVNLYTEYGLPSSHAQLMWFFTVYTFLFIIFRLHHISHSIEEITWKALLASVVAGLTFIVSFSRVYLLYHSWSQVLWGALTGSVLGGIWFTFSHVVLTPYFPVIASWGISEKLMIRDTSLIPNILWFEYTQARAENRARCRKLISMKSQ